MVLIERGSNLACYLILSLSNATNIIDLQYLQVSMLEHLLFVVYTVYYSVHRPRLFSWIVVFMQMTLNSFFCFFSCFFVRLLSIQAFKRHFLSRCFMAANRLAPNSSKCMSSHCIKQQLAIIIIIPAYTYHGFFSQYLTFSDTRSLQIMTILIIVIYATSLKSSITVFFSSLQTW